MKDKFEVGDRVALQRSSWGEAIYEEAVVEKVYASGNFTLKGSKQQYRPGHRSYISEGMLEAQATGDGYHRPAAILWDEAADKVISKAMLDQKKQRALKKVQEQVAGLRHDTVSDELMTALFAALKRHPPSSE